MSSSEAPADRSASFLYAATNEESGGPQKRPRSESSESGAAVQAPRKFEEAPVDDDHTDSNDDTRDDHSDDDDDVIDVEEFFYDFDVSEDQQEITEEEEEGIHEGALLEAMCIIEVKSEESIAALAQYAHLSLPAACVHGMVLESMRRGQCTVPAEWLVEDHLGKRMPVVLTADEIQSLLLCEDYFVRKWVPLCSLNTLGGLLVQAANVNVESRLVDELLGLPQLAGELATSSRFWRVAIFSQPNATLPTLARILRMILGRADCREVTEEAIFEQLPESSVWDVMSLIGTQLLFEPSEERERVALVALKLLRQVESQEVPMPRDGCAPARQIVRLVRAFRWSTLFVEQLQRICARRDMHAFNRVVLARAVKRLRAGGMQDLFPEPSPSAMELAMRIPAALIMLYEDGNAGDGEDDGFVAEPVLYHAVHQYNPMPVVKQLVEQLGAEVDEVCHGATPLVARLKWLAQLGRARINRDDTCVLYLLAHGASRDVVPEKLRDWLPAPEPA